MLTTVYHPQLLRIGLLLHTTERMATSMSFVIGLVLITELLLGTAYADYSRDDDDDDNDDDDESMMMSSEEEMMSSNGSVQMEDTSEERKKKKTAMADMYMAFMMFKTMISTAVSMLTPIIQLKSLGFTAITTLINVLRFLMQLKQFKNSQQQLSQPWKTYEVHHSDGWNSN